MPYKIVQHGDKFSVVVRDTGKVVGTHPSKNKAQAQMAALYANVPEATQKMGPYQNQGSAQAYQIVYKPEGCEGWGVILLSTGETVSCVPTQDQAKNLLKLK